MKTLCGADLRSLARIAGFSALFILASELGRGVLAGDVVALQTGIASSAVEQHYEGVITDAHCGAKHSPAINLAASDCTRVCVHSGEQFALVDAETVYVLDGDRGELKRLAGERVRVAGVAEGNRIAVSSVAAYK